MNVRNSTECCELDARAKWRGKRTVFSAVFTRINLTKGRVKTQITRSFLSFHRRFLWISKDEMLCMFAGKTGRFSWAELLVVIRSARIRYSALQYHRSAVRTLPIRDMDL